METDQLSHLNRIAKLQNSLSLIPWLESDELDQITTHLLDFDASYWSFIRILSLPLYSELTDLLASDSALALLPERPQIAVIVPVHAARRELLLPALLSLRQQVGVAIDCLISVDGREEDFILVEELLNELNAKENTMHWRASVFMSDRNRGVGMCRNRALREVKAPFFTCLDADDLFHPLRCLHSLLVLLLSGVDRLNTGWSRVSIREAKILLINGVLSTHGHNSFIARSSLLKRYGYQANLRVHEDTELVRRLQYFHVPMLDSGIVSHYLNSEANPEYRSLSTPLRTEVYPIEGHPYLCGSVIGSIDDERIRIQAEHSLLYDEIVSAALLKAFPPD